MTARSEYAKLLERLTTLTTNLRLRRLPDTKRNRKTSFLEPKLCAQCGKSFLTLPVGGAKYCSPRCHKDMINESRRQEHNTCCAMCGGVLTAERSTRKFCSNACRQGSYYRRKTS